MRQVLALCLLLAVSSSCLHTMTAAQTRPAPQSQQRRQDFLLWGLVPLQSFSGSNCPDGISRVDTSMTLPNVLFTAVTFGLYWAVSIDTWCAEGTQAAQGVPLAPRGFYVVPTP